MPTRGDGDHETAAPTEAFEVLGNETRLAIVRELARDRRVDWRYAGRGFAELRRSVGVRDAGTFSYHLDRLQDRYVVKDDGAFVLTDAGLEVADALRAGTFDPARFDVDGETTAETACPSCSAALRVRYRNGRCAVVCPTHGEHVVTSVPPAAVADHAGEALLRFVLRNLHQEIEDARNGVCFHCTGRMRASVQTDAPLCDPVAGRMLDGAADVAVEPVVAVLGCERCGATFWSDPRWLVLRHPAVVALLYETTGAGQHSFLDPAVREAAADPEVVDRDPLRVRLAFSRSDAASELLLDEEMAVVESSATA